MGVDIKVHADVSRRDSPRWPATGKFGICSDVELFPLTDSLVGNASSRTKQVRVRRPAPTLHEGEKPSTYF